MLIWHLIDKYTKLLVPGCWNAPPPPKTDFRKSVMGNDITIYFPELRIQNVLSSQRASLVAMVSGFSLPLVVLETFSSLLTRV